MPVSRPPKPMTKGPLDWSGDGKDNCKQSRGSCPRVGPGHHPCKLPSDSLGFSNQPPDRMSVRATGRRLWPWSPRRICVHRSVQRSVSRPTVDEPPQEYVEGRLHHPTRASYPMSVLSRGKQAASLGACTDSSLYLSPRTKRASGHPLHSRSWLCGQLKHCCA